jgi:mannose-6-phosphate isomerase-like protein (cupin superfamily)
VAERGDATDNVIPFDELPHVPGAHRFAGAEHGDVPFSVIVIRDAPGSGPVRMHRHPYVEAWVVEGGEATFRLGDRTLVVPAGHIVVGPANVPHGFTNTGRDELRMVSIHAGNRFQTEFLEEGDPA